MSRPRPLALAALVLGLSSSAGPAPGQEPPARVPVQWDKVTGVSKTTPTLQAVVNPPLRRASAIQDRAFNALRDLQADYVRYVPWLPYPKPGVAELEPPRDGKTSWDFSLIDPMTIDFLEATSGHPVILNFSTIPQWMAKTDKPVAYPSDPDQVVWDYTQGSEFHDPTYKQVADHYARLLAWFTQGGFTDELGKRHESGHRFQVPIWEVLNEVDFALLDPGGLHAPLRRSGGGDAARSTGDEVRGGGAGHDRPVAGVLRVLPEPREAQAGHAPRLHLVPLLRDPGGGREPRSAAAHVLHPGRRLPEHGSVRRGDPQAALSADGDHDQRDRGDLRGRPGSGHRGPRGQAHPRLLLEPRGGVVRVPLRRADADGHRGGRRVAARGLPHSVP